MEKSESISLVMPMFNESANVDATLTSLLEKLPPLFADFEIVIADDASTDGCADKVQEWCARDPRIRLVRLPFNQCFGGALRAGFENASKEFLVYTDFDLPVDLACLPQVIREFEDADVLTGYSDAESKHANRVAAIISWGYNFLVHTLFRIQFRDINFGFKAIRRTAFQHIRLRSTSPFVDAEIFARAQRKGFRVKEIPVPFVQRKLGKSNIRRFDVICATFIDMIQLRLHLIVEKFRPVRPVNGGVPERD